MTDILNRSVCEDEKLSYKFAKKGNVGGELPQADDFRQEMFQASFMTMGKGPSSPRRRGTAALGARGRVPGWGGAGSSGADLGRAPGCAASLCLAVAVAVAVAGEMRPLAWATAVLLAWAPVPEVCGALNVTVSPGPVVDFLEGDNATLYCHVSQKRRRDSLLAVRWLFALSDTQETLMIKMTKLSVVQYYGNYSRRVNRQRLHLLEEQRGALYRLSVLILRSTDQGHYICKVQEISRHRNKWMAWSNGSSATEMRVITVKSSEDSSFGKNKEAWAIFQDLYVYAVLVCCVGIISILLFTLIIIWQSLFNKKKSRVKHYLVKCPQNSSGETVTSVTNLVPVQPKKGKRRKEKADVPPAIPAKAPIATTFHKPKLLKPQRKVTLPKIAEESLTYAELELIKPHQKTKGLPTSTVYAQILFEENKL
ncbi:PREDICTED: V-set and transmembrane domain-containing protein 4 [Chrysochloris asiatica]|uniref:V-set and transmembrane domain-containing protein 4 n=1 Tax=Chrysochloris asiatica TaxID=185453 RepID=A0A9B0X199_CHRAS|nr:PREDICTED: V-set and transmembrane domain-containing protein 4 [Chrysochloris asiatica]